MIKNETEKRLEEYGEQANQTIKEFNEMADKIGKMRTI